MQTLFALALVAAAPLSAPAVEGAVGGAAGGTVGGATGAAPAAGAAAGHFGMRAYLKAGQEVVVGARTDMIAVRSSLSVDEAARLVEAAAAAKVPEALVSGAKLLRPHGLVLVELAHAVTRAQIESLASAVAAREGVRVYPALSRMTGRAFYDEHLVVTALPGHLDDVVAAVIEKTGGAFVRKSLVPHTALVTVGAAVGYDAVDASRALADLPGLVSAEPDLYRELQPLNVVPNDPLFAQQWHLSRQPGSDVPGTGQIFADQAWDTTRGDGVRVAVFDTGIDVDHPDLVDNMLPGFDAANDDDDPRPECSQQFDGRDTVADCPSSAPYKESHGTSVSGTVAGVADNGIGISGVCPHCEIVPVRLLGDVAASSLGIAETFIRAVDPPFSVDVINNSWGPGFSLFFPLSTSEQDAFDHARDAGRDGRGTVILFAAGNDTSDVRSDAYSSNPYVITVAASTNVDDWAFYSNFGFQVDVAAPSQGLPAQQDGFPDDDFGIVTTDVEGDDGYAPGDFETEFNGTSAASPVAAGVAALVLAVNPSLTAEQVRLVLTRSADKVGGDQLPWDDFLSADDQAFLFDYDDTGHANAFGYGRVNAARAVDLARDPGKAGGLCGENGCDFCSAELRCLDRCTSQSDCVDGTICNTTLGACELPRDAPADLLSRCASSPGDAACVCGADCAFCTPTLDTEFNPVDICTTSCATDDDCGSGFDCRLTEPGGPSICAVGDASAGEPNDFFACFSSQIGASLVVTTDGGRELCGDVCFSDEPGACPYGFSCRSADCQCSAQGCFQLDCGPDDDPAHPDPSDFAFPVCLPNPGHADTCSSDLDCQTGDYCKDGACRLDDRGGCDICSACASDDDCAGRGVCIGLQNDGVGQCAWACEDSDPCPGDSVCRAVDARHGQLKVCLSPEGGTDEATRCDPSYTCSVACRDDVPCPDGKICQSGACVVDVTPGDGKNVGVAGGGCHCGASSGADGAAALALLALFGALRRRRRR